MDIYRFFHPHHNPRLISTPVRQIELVELEQAASELKKAIVRAQLRLEKKQVSPLMPSHFIDVIKAMDFVSRSLQTLCDAHPGDNDLDLSELVQERTGCSGWENWSTLLQEQLSTVKPISPMAQPIGRQNQS